MADGRGRGMARNGGNLEYLEVEEDLTIQGWEAFRFPLNRLVSRRDAEPLRDFALSLRRNPVRSP